MANDKSTPKTLEGARASESRPSECTHGAIRFKVLVCLGMEVVRIAR